MAQGPAGRSCRRVILSNREILSGIAAGRFNISPLAGHDPTISPFNTSAVDLRLNTQIQVPKRHPAALDLRQPGIAEFLSRISETLTITDEQAFTLTPGNLSWRKPWNGLISRSPPMRFVTAAAWKGGVRWRGAEFLFISRLRPFTRGLKARSLWKSPILAR